MNNMAIPAVGTYVCEKDLRNVYDTHIVLKDVEIKNNTIYGIVAYVGSKLTDESDRLNKLGTTVAHIFNDKIDVEDEITYDE